MPSVLHAILVAAIFTTYMGSMVTLFAYIARTGREHRTGEPERTEDSREPELAVLPLAA